jgi:NTE family protein
VKADAVFEGGGIRGIAYCGAYEVFERQGVQFQRVAGSSAGAIFAALIACGKSSRDILAIMRETDFRRFLDRSVLTLPFDVFFRLGMCKGDAFKRWMSDAVGGAKLGDTKLPLHVLACDIRNREIVEMSSASHPDMPIADAVRMSMSIPFVFRPVKWLDWPSGDVTKARERVCVDGGLADNFPVETFDVGGAPRWPTFGFLLDEGPQKPTTPRNVVELGLHLTSIVRDAIGERKSEHNLYRTVSIPDCGVNWLRFSLSDAEKEALVRSGRYSAAKFFSEWNKRGGFDGYVSRWRSATSATADAGESTAR